MDAVVAALTTRPDVFDVERLFFFGCSMGSAFSSYAAVCKHQQAPGPCAGVG